MKKSFYVFCVLFVVSISVLAQDKAGSTWQVDGFIEEQYRPTQDFSATSIWFTAKQKGAKVGVFNFSQVVNPAKPTKVNWWQTYTGVYGGANTSVAYVEGGVAAGVEAGVHARFAGFGFLATKRGGVSAFMIHERGLYQGSSWTRLQVMKQVVKGLKLGYHHQTFLGNGVNVDVKIPKTPISVFGAVTRDKGQTKSMIAIRYNF